MSYPRTWRALSIWPLVSKAAFACVSDAWPPDRPGGWRRSSLSRANHHLKSPCLILSPCRRGDFNCLPKRDKKECSGPLPLLLEAGPLCSICPLKPRPTSEPGSPVGCFCPLISPCHPTSSLPPSLTKTFSLRPLLQSYYLLRAPKASFLDYSTVTELGHSCHFPFLSCQCLGPLWPACSYYHPHHPLCKFCCVRQSPRVGCP